MGGLILHKCLWLEGVAEKKQTEPSTSPLVSEEQLAIPNRWSVWHQALPMLSQGLKYSYTAEVRRHKP